MSGGWYQVTVSYCQILIWVGVKQVEVAYSQLVTSANQCTTRMFTQQRVTRICVVKVSNLTFLFCCLYPDLPSEGWPVLNLTSCV